MFQENTFAGTVSGSHVGGAPKQTHHMCVSRHAQEGESPELDGPRTVWLETPLGPSRIIPSSVMGPWVLYRSV